MSYLVAAMRIGMLRDRRPWSARLPAWQRTPHGSANPAFPRDGSVTPRRQRNPPRHGLGRTLLARVLAGSSVRLTAGA
ncbi:MAG: hypothetical protein V7637_5165, partial [Mycobacteriales bacterium]